MAWPLSQDYNEAVQNPQINFSDPELRQGQIATNALGIPLPCSGNFADVYAVECPATNTKWAVKCFTREVPGLRERYGEISKYLRQTQLPFMVDFGYLEQGIRVASRWYPVLKMQWIEGHTLNAFVRDNLDRPTRLDALLRVWLRMAQRLREANIAHCDLQHGNLLLVPDSSGQALAVKLIDYDGMWVPALANTPSGEVGHPAYQHPQRLREGTYRPEVDRFSLLAVATALRCLQVGGPTLWERYDTGDNLLFRPQDFEVPGRSPLFAELLRMSQPGVRELVVALIDAARMPLERVPHVTDLLPVETSPRSAIRPAPPPRRERSKVASPPAAPSAGDPEEPPIIRSRGRRKRSSGALAWMAIGATVVLTALVGGVLYWVTHSTKHSEKTPPPSEQQLARTNSSELMKEPEEEVSALPLNQPQKDATPAPTIEPPKGDDPPVAPPKKPVNPSTQVRPQPTETTVKNGPPSSPPASSTDSIKPKSARADGKLSLPDKAIQEAREKHIRDAFRGPYERRKPVELAALAAKFLKYGQNDKEEPGLRFVYLREASDLAAQAGDSVLSLRAVDEMSRTFALDGDDLPRKTAALERTAKGARTLGANKTLAEQTLAVLDEAVAADDYEQALKLASVAQKAAAKSGDRFLKDMTFQRRPQLEHLQKEYAKRADAALTLATKPRDAEANRIIGQFRCFEKGDWQKGLPLLARGDDAKLKELAEEDLAAPAEVHARVAIGDGWWQLAAKERGLPRANLQQRACYWYELALPDSAQTNPLRLEKLIRRHHKDYPALAWGHLDISQATLTLGTLQLSKGEKDITTRQAYSGPIEVRALARTEKNNIRLRAGRGASVIFNWEVKPEELRITRPDGNDRPESGSLATAPLQPLRPNVWYDLRWRITERGMSVAVNGNTIFQEPHTNDLSEKSPISIHAADSDLEILSFTVEPIRKKAD